LSGVPTTLNSISFNIPLYSLSSILGRNRRAFYLPTFCQLSPLPPVVYICRVACGFPPLVSSRRSQLLTQFPPRGPPQAPPFVSPARVVRLPSVSTFSVSRCTYRVRSFLRVTLHYGLLPALASFPTRSMRAPRHNGTIQVACSSHGPAFTSASLRMSLTRTRNHWSPTFPGPLHTITGRAGFRVDGYRPRPARPSGKLTNPRLASVVGKSVLDSLVVLSETAHAWQTGKFLRALLLLSPL